jgi:large subunit ribosomal protein L13
VVLLGAALGAAAATYSARAPVATLGVGGGNMRRKDLKDLEEGEEITDEMRAAYIRPKDRIHPVTGERVRGGQWRLDRAGSARISELTKAGIEITDEAALSGPYEDKNKTRHPGHAAIQKPNKKWLIVDAEGMRLGRMATEIAIRLMGKDKVTYYPGADVGDYVVVINADKVIVTGKKYDWKFYRRHSGRPGGMKLETFKELQARIPERIVEKAVKGMLPKNPHGRELFRHLKVYKGSEHPHEAQQPVEMEWAYKAKAQEPDKRKMAFLGVLGTEVAALAVGGTETEFSLTNLAPLKGSQHRKIRKGRGISAGKGKTCGFGDNGQKARSGRSVRYNKDGTKFAGGSNLYYRMDSRKDHNRPFGPGHSYTKYSLVKLSHLNNLADGETVSHEDLIRRGIITKGSGNKKLKKVVGCGKLTTKNLTIKAHGFTESAKSAIEENGGKVVVLTKHNKVTDQEGKVVAALALHGWAIQKEERSPAPQMKLKGLCNWGIRGERITKDTPARRKRQLHVRKKVSGTAERPRLCVHRSNNHMYAQIINDEGNDGHGHECSHILCGVSTMNKTAVETTGGNGATKVGAYKVGELIAEKAKSLGVEKVVFDRAGYQYHGRIAAVAEGARSAGLVF